MQERGSGQLPNKQSGIGGRPPGDKLDIPIRTKTDVSEVIIYATKTDKKYHKGSCRYLKKSRIPMKLADAKKVLTPCGSCRPPKAGPYPDRWARRRPTADRSLASMHITIR